MTAFYNEKEPYAAQWLRNLIAAGHIAPGDVDERSIVDVRASDLVGYAQVHLFAGIGIWSHSLRLSGWPDDREVWTGSCPCQPFSAAGQQRGFADERHLWPEMFRLIGECRPVTVLGEQVASKPGLGWFDTVSTDLEGAGYAVGAADLGAASVGAPHIRQRLWFVAHDNKAGQREQRSLGLRGSEIHDPDRCSEASYVVNATREQAGFPGRAWESGEPLANNNNTGLQGRRREVVSECADKQPIGPCSDAIDVAVPDGGDASAERQQRSGQYRQQPQNGRFSFWGAADWIECRDGKRRPVEPATFPLAHGYPSRVGRLRAYGNAISPQVASAFIEAAMRCMP